MASCRSYICIWKPGSLEVYLLRTRRTGTRSLQVVERGGGGWGREEAATSTVAQVASFVLNIQWRHVLNSTCRLATANHMFLQHHSAPLGELLSSLSFSFFLYWITVSSLNRFLQLLNACKDVYSFVFQQFYGEKGIIKESVGGSICESKLESPFSFLHPVV